MGALESKENGEQVSPLLDTKWTIVARQEQRRVVDAKMVRLPPTAARTLNVELMHKRCTDILGS